MNQETARGVAYRLRLAYLNLYATPGIMLSGPQGSPEHKAFRETHAVLREMLETAHRLDPLPIELGCEVKWKARPGKSFIVHKYYRGGKACTMHDITDQRPNAEGREFATLTQLRRVFDVSYLVQRWEAQRGQEA